MEERPRYGLMKRNAETRLVLPWIWQMISTAIGRLTALARTVKVAVLRPAGTVTEVGITTRLGMLAEILTLIPPDGAI